MVPDNYYFFLVIPGIERNTQTNQILSPAATTHNNHFVKAVFLSKNYRKLALSEANA